MAYSPLAFTKNWNSFSDFPTYEDNEAQVRADMQELHDQTKTYLNETLLPELEAQVLAGRTFLDCAVAPEDWKDSTADPGFPYQADIPCAGVTVYDVPLVTFQFQDAASTLLSSLAYAGDGFVRIYANQIPEDTLTVASIFCVKGGG